mmetsp:Transcript_34811/g.96265  ORF Transcript_34811/g.96265 Transcript_34811/m.96265 type:complete len:406 (-) Transcript_34811:42-1259(-)
MPSASREAAAGPCSANVGPGGCSWLFRGPLQRHGAPTSPSEMACLTAGASTAAEPTAQQADHKSAFVLGLAESQGTLAVVAALLAGFSYSGFCSVTREEVERAHPVVQYAFVASNVLSASMALFVTIVCSLCEQQGRVARSFAVLRGFEPEFEETVHEWWKSFAQCRTNAVFFFIYSIPVFFISMACIALIKLPLGPCCVAVGVLLLAGLVVFHQLLLVNDLFRAYILRFFTSSDGFAAPSLDPEPSPEAIPADQVSRSLSSVVRGTLKHWPSRQSTRDLLEHSDAPASDSRVTEQSCTTSFGRSAGGGPRTSGWGRSHSWGGAEKPRALGPAEAAGSRRGPGSKASSCAEVARCASSVPYEAVAGLHRRRNRRVSSLASELPWKVGLHGQAELDYVAATHAASM